jgi:hypothetical protein
LFIWAADIRAADLFAIHLAIPVTGLSHPGSICANSSENMTNNNKPHARIGVDENIKEAPQTRERRKRLG